LTSRRLWVRRKAASSKSWSHVSMIATSRGHPAGGLWAKVGIDSKGRAGSHRGTVPIWVGTEVAISGLRAVRIGGGGCGTGRRVVVRYRHL
jgi:hypothetical protein